MTTLTHAPAESTIDPSLRHVYREVLRRNAGEHEFHQAVEEVLGSLGPVVKALRGGRLVMGLRLTSRGTAGSSSFSFRLFRFRETLPHWALAGEIPAGSDDTAGCDSEDGEPCQLGSSKGRLEILPEDSVKALSWPPVRVTLTGTLRGDDGKLRPATDRDTRTYRFDEAAGAYR